MRPLNNNKTVLTAVWLSVDKMAAAEMMFLYLRDCLLQRYFDETALILWGPSVELAAKDEYIRLQLELLRSVGVDVRACRACASLYGVVEELEEQGIPVEPMGLRLSEIIKSDQGLIFI